MGYVVTAPLIQARTVGGTFVHVYEGGNLPDDQDPAQLEQLIAGEMVAKVGSAAPDEDDRPAGNASREEWETYALANGKTEEELADLSRNDIRDLFA